MRRGSYACSACGQDHPRKVGRCVGCGQWNTVVEAPASAKAEDGRGGGRVLPFAPPGGARGRLEEPPRPPPRPVPLDQVPAEETRRVSTGIKGLDRVLGGGAACGSLVLVSGDPGVGKSTILGHALCLMGKMGMPTYYASAEESRGQVAERAHRTRAVHPLVHVVSLADNPYVEHVTREIERSAYAAAVVDSIQTLRSRKAPGLEGSAEQVKAVVNEIKAVVKRNEDDEEANDVDAGVIDAEEDVEDLDVAEDLDDGDGPSLSEQDPDGVEDDEKDEPPPPVVFLVCHITKDGEVAGPKTVEHLVDTVLYFEPVEGAPELSRLRVRGKNRHGARGVEAVFKMTARGLVEVDPEKAAEKEEAFLRKQKELGRQTKKDAGRKGRGDVVSLEAARAKRAKKGRKDT